MYPPEMVAPLAKDLTDYGFDGLTSASQVADVIENTEGTVLLVVNSVCGCAAANARPGAKMALQHAEKAPTKAVTVFAGVDKEATNAAREYMIPYPASSPSIALFKDGKLVHFLERLSIEGQPADRIAQNLVMAFNKFC